MICNLSIKLVKQFHHDQAYLQSLCKLNWNVMVLLLTQMIGRISFKRCQWWVRWHVLGIPDSKVHGANMGPTWGRQDPGGPHVGHLNLALWDYLTPGIVRLIKPATVVQLKLFPTKNRRSHVITVISLCGIFAVCIAYSALNNIMHSRRPSFVIT